MDAIILAAGRNERLKGIVAEGMKPLLLVNGKPIIIDLLDKMREIDVGIHRIIVVSPTNASAVCDVLKSCGYLNRFTSIVVQPEALGPVDALRRGFEAHTGTDTLILCGDNIIPTPTLYEFIKNPYDDSHAGWIAVKSMGDLVAAKRFTVVSMSGTKFTEDGSQEIALPWSDSRARVWLGPVRVYQSYLEAIFNRYMMVKAMPEKLSEVWNAVVREHHDTKPVGFKLIAADCQDIGIPEALP